MLTGTGAPAADYGNNGDSYIDTSTWNYYVRENDVWVLKGNIKGEEAKTYIPCIFYDIDGTKLYEFYFEKGTDIEYKGRAPQFDEHIEYDQGEKITYKFIGWDKPLTNIQEPTIFTAKYESKNYGVTFRIVSSNGNAFQTLAETEVSRGETAIYPGPTPVCREHPSWEFVGWDLDTTNVTCNMYFTAVFRPSQRSDAVELRYVDYDGRLLGREYRTKGYGSSQAFHAWFASYDRSIYTQPVVYNSTTGKAVARSYKDWDKPITTPYHVNSVITATYYETIIENPVKVTFLHEDGHEVYSTYVESGNPVVYPYETPFSYDDTKVKQFAGWDKDLSSITEDTVVSPTFKTVLRSENGEYPNRVVTDTELISKLNEIEEVDSHGYVSYENEKYYRAESASSFIKSTQTHYNVSGNTYFKVEPVKWRFLGEQEGASLVLSEYLIDYMFFDNNYNINDGKEYYRGASYHGSVLHEYMQDTVFAKMFNQEDNKVVKIYNLHMYNDSLESYKLASDFGEYDLYSDDHLFLLSGDDYNNPALGFYDNASRLAFTTDYMRSVLRKGNGSYPFAEQYLTRTSDFDKITIVAPDINDVGAEVKNIGSPKKEYGLRPACWVKFTTI